MKNKILSDIRKILKEHFHCEFKHNDVLAVAESREQHSFAYLTIDDDYPDAVLLSLAIDYPNSRTAVNLALVTNMYYQVISAEPFFVSQTGKMLWGDEAEKQFDIETYLPIEEIEPENEQKH